MWNSQTIQFLSVFVMLEKPKSQTTLYHNKHYIFIVIPSGYLLVCDLSKRLFKSISRFTAFCLIYEMNPHFEVNLITLFGRVEVISLCFVYHFQDKVWSFGTEVAIVRFRSDSPMILPKGFGQHCQTESNRLILIRTKQRVWNSVCCHFERDWWADIFDRFLLVVPQVVDYQDMTFFEDMVKIARRVVVRWTKVVKWTVVTWGVVYSSFKVEFKGYYIFFCGKSMSSLKFYDLSFATWDLSSVICHLRFVICHLLLQTINSWWYTKNNRVLFIN